MNDLSSAMKAAGNAAADRGNAIGGAGAPLEPNRPKIEAAVARAASGDDDAFDDAHWVVNRHIKKGGRDPSEPLETDSAALRSIRDILIGVQGSGA